MHPNIRTGWTGWTGWTSPVLPVLLFLALASVTTYPMAFTDQAYDHADTYFNSWLISWNAHALTTLQDPLNPPVFQGQVDGAGRSDLLLAQSVPAIPFLLGGMEPVRVHNILFVLSLAFAGFAVFLFGRDLGLTRPGALFAGSAFVCLPFIQSHLWHLQLMSMGFTILALKQGLRYLRGRGNGWPVMVLVLLQGMASLYYWYFACLALALMFVWSLFTIGSRRSVGLLGWTAGGSIALLPLLLPQLRNAASWRMDTIASTDVAALLSPWGTSLLEGWARPALMVGEAAFWPGLAVTAGAAWWLVRGRRDNCIESTSYLVLMGAFFFLFSLGPTVVVYGSHVSRGFFRLLGPLPGLTSIRLPGRAAFLFLVPLILAAGRVMGKRGWMAAAGIGFCLIEVLPGRLPMTPVEHPPWFAWVGEESPELVAYIPLSTSMVRPEPECSRLLGSVPYFTPMVNGYSTSLPERYAETAGILNSWPSAEADSLLDLLGVDCVISHDRRLPDADMIWEVGERVTSGFIRPW